MFKEMKLRSKNETTNTKRFAQVFKNDADLEIRIVSNEVLYWAFFEKCNTHRQGHPSPVIEMNSFKECDFSIC